MEHDIEIDHELTAGKGRRLANCLIDGILCTTLLVLVYLVMIMLYKYADMQGLMLWMLNMGSFTKYMMAAGVTGLYYLVFETLTGGRTPGKYVTNTLVVNSLGHRPSAVEVLKRTLVRLIPLEAFTFIGKYNIGLHDSASKTFVVDVRKYNYALQIKTAYAELGINPEGGYSNILTK